METGILYEQMLETLAKTGIEVELRDLADDDITIKSGLCEIGGRKTLIIDERLDTRARLAVAADALRTVDLEGVYVPPAVREFLGLNE